MTVKKLLMMILVITLLLCLPFVAKGAEETHSHCICGGAAEGVGDHAQCETVTWTPLSQALAKIGKDLSHCDFGLLPGGCYYLDGDVTVTGSNPLGSKKDTLSTKADTVVTMSICLNGYSIHRDDRAPFGNLNMGSTLNICDCSYDGAGFAGSVIGAVSDNGSVIYTYSNSVLNIYGGNYYGRATKNGGVLVVANDGCGDVDGNGKYEEADRAAAQAGVFNFYNGRIVGCSVTSGGGAIRIYHTAAMNMYGGEIVGGSAQKGGAIYVGNGTLQVTGGSILGGTASESHASLYVAGGRCTLAGGSLTGGMVNGRPELCVVLDGKGRLWATYTDLSMAFAAVEGRDDRYLRMIGDGTSNAAVSGTVYLDLCGHDLSGIRIAGELYCMDSTTNGYDDARAGKLTPASGSPMRTCRTASERVGSAYRYLALEQEGSWSFHRFYMSITKISLRINTVGVGYKAAFVSGPAVTEAMKDNAGYGYKLWINPENTVTRAMAADTLQGSREVSLRINNFLNNTLSLETNEERAAMPVSACAFIQLEDGTVVESDAVSYTFRQMVELADPMYPDFSSKQRTFFHNFSKKYSQIMRGWDMPNSHHVSGATWGIWSNVNQTQFLGKVSSSNVLASGGYALTSDVDLGDRTLKILEGSTVRICLNGYTITGNRQMFRVWGTLDICDCHSTEEEGSMISHLKLGSGTTLGPVFAAMYSSEVNLYGGHLKATEQVTSGGVCVVYHQGTGDLASKPAGKFNMYGGSLSGGNVTNNGGLIITWENAQVNIYGGVLSGGKAGLAGGAIHAVGGSAVNLYGGAVTGNTAATGGGINAKGSTVSLAGNVQITGNTATEQGNNLYLANGDTVLHAGDMEIGAKVGVTCTDYRVLGSDPKIAQTVYMENDALEVKYLYGEARIVPEGIREITTPKGFTAGFGQRCINPTTIEGIPLGGYGNSEIRLAEAQDPDDWDDLYVQVTAVTDAAGETVLIITCDLIRAFNITAISEAIHAVTNVPANHIFFNASHSHSVPDTSLQTDPMIQEYTKDLTVWFAEAAYDAMADRTAATMETGSFDVSFVDKNGKTKRMNFNRHYKYTDAQGVVKYFGDNFGEDMRSDPTADHIWEIDPTMHLVRFVREGKDILLANWRIHPHQTGGSQKRKLSADVIGTLRYYMAQECPDTWFSYIQGAAGNANSSSKLTSTATGLSSYTKYGQTLAKAIKLNLKCLSGVEEPGLWQVDNQQITIYLEHFNEERYQKALELKAYCDENFDGSYMKYENDYCRLNSDGMFESYYEVTATIRQYESTEVSRQAPVNVFTLGDSLGFFTAPNELWDSVSVTVENASPFKTTICVGYSMANFGYLPYYPEAYLEAYFPAGTALTDGVPYKSYESGCRSYKAPDTVNSQVEYWIATLNRLYSQAAE